MRYLIYILLFIVLLPITLLFGLIAMCTHFEWVWEKGYKKWVYWLLDREFIKKHFDNK